LKKEGFSNETLGAERCEGGFAAVSCARGWPQRIAVLIINAKNVVSKFFMISLHFSCSADLQVGIDRADVKASATN